jgi:hypothetical protein
LLLLSWSCWEHAFGVELANLLHHCTYADQPTMPLSFHRQPSLACFDNNHQVGMSDTFFPPGITPSLHSLPLASPILLTSLVTTPPSSNALQCMQPTLPDPRSTVPCSSTLPAAPPLLLYPCCFTPAAAAATAAPSCHHGSEAPQGLHLQVSVWRQAGDHLPH